MLDTKWVSLVELAVKKRVYLCFVLVDFVAQEKSDAGGEQEQNGDNGQTGNQRRLIGQCRHPAILAIIRRALLLLVIRIIARGAAILWLGAITLSRPALNASLIARGPFGPTRPPAINHATGRALVLVE